MKSAIKTIGVSVILSYPAWVSLCLGWLTFFLSLLLSFEVPSSGALMICGVLLAEVLHSSNEWLRFASSMPSSMVQKVDIIADSEIPIFQFEVFPNRELVGNRRTAVGVPLCSRLGRELEIINHGPLSLRYGDGRSDEGIWSLGKETKKYDNIFQIFGAFTAFFGSVLWGYGHLFWH